MQAEKLTSALNNKDLSAVTTLLAAGVNPNVPTENGTFPIIVGVYLGFEEGVRGLIQGGADVNLHNLENETPLGAAIQSRNYDLCDLLLLHGADPNAVFRDLSGHNVYPLEAAVREGVVELVSLLERFGARREQSKPRPNKETVGTTTTELHLDSAEGVVADLSGETYRGIDINARCGEDMAIVSATPLILASHFGSPEWVRQLIEAGADVHLKDAENKDAIMRAVESANLEAVDLLIRAGAELDREYQLIYAAQVGNVEVVRELLRQGADPHFSDKGREHPFNGPPICWAAARGHTNVVETLIPHSRDEDVLRARTLAAAYSDCEMTQEVLDRYCTEKLGWKKVQRRVEVDDFDF